MSVFKNKKIAFYLVLALVLIYAITKAIKGGTDINVYLYASQQLLNGENIYDNNIYNNYLYSPLFALILSPFSSLGFTIARVIWAIINLILAIRLFYILRNVIKKSIDIPQKIMNWWSFGTVFLSLGFLNHNLILGQITIVIIWLTLEGLYQICIEKRSLKGASLIALGINIKIIPLLALFYLFFKMKMKPLIISGTLVIVMLFLPSPFVGLEYNLDQIKNWVETINPSSTEYVFEDNNGTQSLNAIIPSYFYTFEDPEIPPANVKRQIADISHDMLLTILQIIRVIVLISSLYLFFFKYKSRTNHFMYFYWEVAYLCLINGRVVVDKFR